MHVLPEFTHLFSLGLQVPSDKSPSFSTTYLVFAHIPATRYTVGNNMSFFLYVFTVGSFICVGVKVF